MKKLQIKISTIIAMLLIAVFTSCGSTDHLTWYRNYQKSVEYDARMKSNKGFSLESSKDALKDLEDKQKKERADFRDSVKVAEVRAKIEKLKAN